MRAASQGERELRAPSGARGFFVGVLLVGFGMVLAAMVTSGAMALRAIGQIDRETSSLTERQIKDTELVDEFARHQASLGVLLYSLADEHRQAGFMRLAADLRRERELTARLLSEAASTPQSPEEKEAWQAVRKATEPLFDEAARLIARQSNNSPELSRLYRNLTAASGTLMEISLNEASQSRGVQMMVDAGLLQSSRNLFLAALALAAVSAAASVAGTVAAFRRLERRASDMTRLSIHILDEQEESARRFSQDMHDEFGQTLNAVESSLTVVRGSDGSDRERLRDCIELVREAQRTARDISQLVRPRILDDFGLDAGLRELARGFSQRTGIVVDYTSQIRDRLDPAVETHLFRICQEALTNASRHSPASKVDISLAMAGRELELSIADNGGGLPANSGRPGGLGILGMKERAHAAGGTLEVRSQAGNGVTVRARIPLRQPPAAEPLREAPNES